VTTNETTFAPTHLLQWFGYSLKAAAFNRAAAAHGIIEKFWRPSSKPGGKPKSFWRLGVDGGAYAIEYPNDHGPGEMIVGYRLGTFESLMELLASALAVYVSDGIVKPFDRCPVRAAAYRAEFEAKQREREDAVDRTEQF
jgi:hypothetical protein